MHMQGNDLHYTVTGRGEFPIDMLRYDDSRAADRVAQDIIDEHADPLADSTKEVTVHLVIPFAEGRLPSAERWRSFQWSVVGLEEEESEVAYVARLRREWDALEGSLTDAQREAMNYFRPDRPI